MSDETMIQEFYAEALTLLEEAEQALIALENGADFTNNFNIIFRTFHSVKGAAGMFEFIDMQKDFHFMENLLEKYKSEGTIPAEIIDLFLRGIDHTIKTINGEPTSFQQINPLENKIISAKDKSNVQDIKKKIAEKQIKAKAIKKYEIVIVDDEPEICDIIANSLAHDYKIKVFNNPIEACDYIQTATPDLVFTDFQMPEMTGLQVTKEVHNIHPHLPIILVSGYLTVDVCIECLAEGASGFITKPFKINHLINIANVNIQKYQTYKLLSQSINCLFYQFPELEEYLVQSGKENIKAVLKGQIKEILTNFRKLQNSA